jgi:DNA-directed RNA polymerase subunit RPC12/RpoP
MKNTLIIVSSKTIQCPQCYHEWHTTGAHRTVDAVYCPDCYAKLYVMDREPAPAPALVRR